MKPRLRLSAPMRALGALGLLMVAGLAGTLPAVAGTPQADAPGAGAAQPEGAASEPGVWQPHKVELVYMGFTSTYSCDGMQNKIELLLRTLGARPGFKVMTYGCPFGFGMPSRFVSAAIEFQSLQPAPAGEPPADQAGDGGSGSTAPKSIRGHWRSVELAPRRPYDLQNGDCELIEQFHDKVLPLFSIRQPKVILNCIPFQDSAGPYDLRFEVFSPLPDRAKKGGGSTK